MPLDNLFDIPPGRPIMTCPRCRQRVALVADGDDIALVTYAGGEFPQRGERHLCAGASSLAPALSGNHPATLPDSERPLRTPCPVQLPPAPALWDGGNETPGQQRAARVAASRAEMPRLSADLPGPVAPDRCQSCGAGGSLHGVECELPALIRWREHDAADNPLRVVVVLCRRCSDRLIEPHPRLYAELPPFAPWPGCMPVCVDCALRDGLRCTHADLKDNGGPGLNLIMPHPVQAHVRYAKRKPDGRRGEYLTMWTGPVACAGKRN